MINILLKRIFMGATGLITMMGIEFYFDSKINKVKHLIFGHNTTR